MKTCIVYAKGRKELLHVSNHLVKGNVLNWTGLQVVDSVIIVNLTDFV